MAMIDVKEYYYVMLNQYIACKNDLSDFEQALKDGHITEEQLQSMKEDVNNLKTNLDRIQYILYLFDLPKRKEKKVRFIENNSALKKYFDDIGVSTTCLKDENENTLSHLRAEIKKLKGDK